MSTESLYDSLWANTPVRATDSWRSWDIIRRYIKVGSPMLELGPGTRPRFPITTVTTFVELSSNAAKALENKKAKAVIADFEQPLPFSAGAFLTVGAFDVIEHIKNDDLLLSEISRILAPGGYFICSVPLGMKYWTAWDAFVGHYRRYDAGNFCAQVALHGLLPRAVYPTGGFLQFLATTFVARPVAYIFVGIVRYLPKLAHIGERFLVVPVTHSCTLLQAGYQRVDPSGGLPLGKYPHAIFVFEKPLSTE